MIFFIKLILIKFKNQLQSKSKIGKDEHDYVIKNDLNLKASFLFADIVKRMESVFSVLSEEKEIRMEIGDELRPFKKNRY